MTAEQSKPRAINPFVIPGWEHQPLRPLCPWAHPEHITYYVPVDDHEAVFDDFVRQMTDSDSLRSEGRFVLVTGDQGCGKTAMLHRIVDWTFRSLDRSGTRSVIIDLTLDRNLTSAQLCARLFDELKLLAVLPEPATKDVDRLTLQPERFYPYLSKTLYDGVLIVLLPATHKATELLQHADWVRGRICFFAELTTREQPRLDSRVPIIVLQVGDLKPGDARRFVEERLARQTKAVTFPAIPVDMLYSLDQYGISTIAQLQRILVATYEDRLRHAGSDDPNAMITYKDLITNIVAAQSPSDELHTRIDHLSEETPDVPANLKRRPPSFPSTAREENPQWDFFVSYTQDDRAWAEWVAWQLEDAGYQVLVQAWDFVAGTNWQAGMQQGIARSDRTIALISPAYLRSVYGQQEWQAAQAADPQGFKSKLVPIRIADCDRPGLLAAVVSFDLFQYHDGDAAREYLLKEINNLRQGRAKPVVAPDFPNQSLG